METVKNTIVVDKVLWEKFKQKLSKTKTINDALVELISEYVEK